MAKARKALINYLCGQIAALRGARNLDIFLYMPRFLRSVRLALHPAQIINQNGMTGNDGNLLMAFHTQCQRLYLWKVNDTEMPTINKCSAAIVAFFLLISALLPAGCRNHGEHAGEATQADSAHYDVLRERQVKDDFFNSASSPLLAGERGKFYGLDYFPVNPELRFQVRLQRYSSPRAIRMATNTGEIRSGLLYGFFEFEVEDRNCHVQVYRLEESFSEPALFIPFLDATSGEETYEGGRYIDLIENTSGIYDLDFNRAYNPYCAYNPEYSCPAPPIENTVTAHIRAGEKKYKP